jgi:hypothetical protein
MMLPIGVGPFDGNGQPRMVLSLVTAICAIYHLPTLSVRQNGKPIGLAFMRQVTVICFGTFSQISKD